MDKSIDSLLYSLGLTANYVGFWCIVVAVDIAIHDPESLTMVTKWLYPEVAKRCRRKNWRSVERDIRKAISIMWERSSDKIIALGGYEYVLRPKNSEFIALLVHYARSF